MAKEPDLQQIKMSQLADLWQLGEEEDFKTPSDRLEETAGELPAIAGYRIMEKLGEGGMGTVWRAEQLSTHREVALKIMRVHTFGSSRVLERFEREVDLAARLEHPNIARVYDSGLHQGLYYYVMELVEGKTLNRYVEEKALSPKEVVRIIKMVAEAIHFAHQRRVIHRDLKPGNILVTDEGRPYVLDFGLAKPTEKEQHSHTVSLQGEVLGTLNYMAPEQLSGHPEDIDIRSDIFALGVIAYQLMTGHLPFGDRLPTAELIMRLKDHDPFLPRMYVPEIDRDLEAIILKALAREPAERYQSVAEFTRDIDNWFTGLPVMARPAGRIYLIRKWMARNRASSIIIALLTVILLGMSSISFYFYKKERRAHQVLLDSREKEKQFHDTMSRVGLATALELWQEGKLERAQAYLEAFDRASREYAAGQFFLSAEPLEERKAVLRTQLGEEDEGFYYFILGEYAWRTGMKVEALEWYKESLRVESARKTPDGWILKQIRLRLMKKDLVS